MLLAALLAAVVLPTGAGAVIATGASVAVVSGHRAAHPHPARRRLVRWLARAGGRPVRRAAAPQACVDRGESGLAASDQCSGTAGFATVHTNRTTSGDVLAADVLLEKGRDLLTGTATAVDAADGSFVVGGSPEKPAPRCG